MCKVLCSHVNMYIRTSHSYTPTLSHSLSSLPVTFNYCRFSRQSCAMLVCSAKFFASSWKSQWRTALTLKMVTSKLSFPENHSSKKTHADLDKRTSTSCSVHSVPRSATRKNHPKQMAFWPLITLYVHTGLLRHTTMAHLQPKSSQGTSRRAGQLSNKKFITWCHIFCAEGILNALKQCISSLWKILWHFSSTKWAMHLF